MVPRRCTFCGSPRITVNERGRMATVACATCAALYRLEERPPDAPHIVARIIPIREPRIASPLEGNTRPHYRKES